MGSASTMLSMVAQQFTTWAKVPAGHSCFRVQHDLMADEASGLRIGLQRSGNSASGGEVIQLTSCIYMLICISFRRKYNLRLYNTRLTIKVQTRNYNARIRTTWRRHTRGVKYAIVSPIPAPYLLLYAAGSRTCRALSPARSTIGAISKASPVVAIAWGDNDGPSERPPPRRVSFYAALGGAGRRGSGAEADGAEIDPRPFACSRRLTHLSIMSSSLSCNPSSRDK
jgi:hypothetical protein